MSTRTTTSQSATCSHCDDDRDPQASVKGSYCSSECFYRAKGAAALGELQKDHQYCATCFARRVDIEYPSTEWIRDHGQPPEAFIGFEHPTPRLARGHGLVYCECGTVEHHDDNEFLRLWLLKETAMNLYARLKDLYAEDKLAHPPDGVTLMQALRETECDWPLAVGRAVYE